jgi:hypothetical protein
VSVLGSRRVRDPTHNTETAVGGIVGHIKVGGAAGNVAVGRDILQLRVQIGSNSVPAGPLLLIAACAWRLRLSWLWVHLAGTE